MKKLFELIRNQHNSIYRISLFVFAILIGVYLMPRKKSFKYEPIEGKPWPHESLISDMEFSILKPADKIYEEKDIGKYKEYTNADFILFDTPGMEKSFEFPKNLIAKLPQGKNYALAGSVSEDNLQNINKLGVNFFDLSSSLESQLGYKDHLKIKSFSDPFQHFA